MVGATSFTQSFTDTRGRRLYEFHDQNVGVGNTQQEMKFNDDLDSKNQEVPVHIEERGMEGTTSICEGIHKSKATRLRRLDR
jgi:hypothetical protein